MLIDGTEYFKFSSPYAGKFTFTTLDTNNIIKIYNTNNVLLATSTTNGTLTFSVNANTNYIIKVLNLSGNRKTIVFSTLLEAISPSTSVPISLSAYKNAIYKIHLSSTAVYDFLIQNPLMDIVLLDSNLSVIKNYETNTLSYNIIGGNTYYVLISNPTSTAISTTLVFSPPTSTSLNVDYSKVVSLGDAFFKFTAPTAGYYRINVIDSLHTGLVIIQSGASSPMSATVLSGSNYTSYKIYLFSQQTVFFGYENVSGATLSFNLMTTDEIFTWYMGTNSSDNPYDNPINGNSIYLKQGEMRTIGAKIGNFIVEDDNLTTLTSPNCSFVGGVLTISPHAVPTSVSSDARFIAVAQNSSVYFLTIYILVDIDVTIVADQGSDDYSTSQGRILWQAFSNNSYDQFVVSIQFVFSDGTTTSVLQSLTGQSGYISLPKYYVTSYSRLYATVKVISVDYLFYRDGQAPLVIDVQNSALGSLPSLQDTFYTNNISMNTMFLGGTGSLASPFQISNERHLNNIRYCATEYREEDNILYYLQKHFVVMNDISLSYPWTPISSPMKSGSIKGFGGNTKLISGLSITGQKGSSNIGFLQTMYGGTIDKITLSGTITIAGNSGNTTEIGIGMFVGGMSGGTISNCTTQGFLYIGPEWLSGTAASGYRNISTGGFAGYAFSSSVIVNSSNNAYIRAYGNTGGFVGLSNLSVYTSNTNTGAIHLCHDNVNITADSQNKSVGGIVGRMTAGSISSNVNTGSIFYESQATEKDKLLKPRMGQLAGWNVNGTVSTTGNYAYGTTEDGNLISWWAWFVTYNQYQYTGTFVGKTGA